MKKFYLIACLCMLMFGSQAQLLTEPFNYPPDATNGIAQQSGGTWVRINSGDSMLVLSGNLSYPGLPASTGNKVGFDGTGSDNYTGFTGQTSGSVYYSFILNVTSLGTLGTTGGYFASLVQDNSSTAYGGSVWTRQSATAGKYNVGISTRSNSAVSWLADDLDVGTSYFIVAAYDIITGTGNDVARIWLNPALGGAEPTAGATAAAGTDLTSAGIGRLLLRQDNATNTPFIEVDEFRVGTSWAQVTPGGAMPSLSASTLTGFGNVCINTTAGPNSFTISGSNLTSASVDVAALAGYSYSTTAGGTYTSTLSLPQSGGSFSQQVFVQFNPTAVQSYNGNIVVSGGGASSVNVAVTGAGVNAFPTLTTGSASSITINSATAAGTINNIGCSAVTAYGIEYSTTSGFTPGTGTQVASGNLAGGNFSSNLSGLAPGTTYYFRAYATNAGGTGYGSEGTFATLSPNPTLSASTLTAFGNVCINTTAGPNTFTITGTNLTSADVNVAALAGYQYATTAGGPYSASLTLTQPGGTYSQQIFVRFTPTAVQSYNGNIAITGGGHSGTVNVAASGSGINTMASVTTGAASAITQTTATAAGSITATGCSSVSAYGIEYSTTNNFTTGTGTQVASGNLSGGNFNSALSGLASNTTYYYRAFATNAGGTAYGSQQSFTTAAPSLNVSSLLPFGDVCVNATAGPNSFTVSGSGLSTANVNVGALAGYTYSTTAGGTYTPTLSISQPGGNFSQTVYVKFTPTAVQTFNGNIPVTGGGTVGTANVAAAGNGVNTLPTVTTGAASNITTHSAVLGGTVSASGCTNVSGLGFEISGIPGFASGTGMRVAASLGGPGNSFTAELTGLVQGATYYYKAYAENAGGRSYGLQQQFTVLPIGEGLKLYPNPIEPGQSMRITVTHVKPGYYGLLFFNSSGVLVFQENMNIQANFINQEFMIPAHLPKGVYRVNLVNFENVLMSKTILVL